MITDSISEYFEIGLKRKAIMACVELAEEQNIITTEETLKIWDYIEKYIPEDKI